MSKAVDVGQFYCVKADNRDLNYEKYYSLGSKSADDSSSYNSHNVRQLSIEEMTSMLKKLDIFKEK